jgi:prepilin signal peptidase PulO-like enzyme (type II secretory pathway)
MDILILLPILLGILAGYFVNYIGDVLPFTRRFSQPACPHCGQAITWKNYLLYRPCNSCGTKRRLRSIIVPVFYLIVTIYLWLAPPSRLGFYLAFLISIYLGVILVIDIEHRLIMHPVSIAGAVLALGTGIYIHGPAPTLIGGAVGFGSMLAFYFLGEVFSRYMSKRRRQAIEEVALGFGDVNLSGISGLFLGWPVILAGLLFTIFAGGFASLMVILFMLIRKRYQAFTPIPYAPFLILAIIFYLYR